MTVAREVARRESTLRQLEVRITRNLDGLLHGDHTTVARGTGMEAGDAREYQPGDDARRIDWPLTARTHVTQVRDTIAERELEVWLIVDGTASLDFGTARCEKRDLAVAAAGSFALLSARRGNRLAAVVFDGDGATTVPPRTGRDAAMALLHNLHHRTRSAPGRGSLAAALRRTRATVRRRGLVVVISDLLDDDGWPNELRLLAVRHQVIVVEVRDRREDELPAVGLLTLVDPETGRLQEVQTNSAKLRARFATAAAERRATIAAAVRSAGASHLVLDTDRDWMFDLVRFLQRQRTRR
jgi:uncharacterized protein (DUF58 family)